MAEHALAGSWPGFVTPGARTELGVVRDECARRCRHGLQVFEAFSPFGLGLRPNGHASFVGGPLLTPDGVEPIKYVYETLLAMLSDFVAVAVVEDVGGEESPYLRIYCAHHTGHAFRVSVPWRRLVNDNVQLLTPLVERTDVEPW